MPDTEMLVRERAYAIWEANGRQHGRDRDHWYQAMREVTLPAIPPPGAVTKLRQAAKAAAAKAAVKKERA